MVPFKRKKCYNFILLSLPQLNIHICCSWCVEVSHLFNPLLLAMVIEGENVWDISRSWHNQKCLDCHYLVSRQYWIVIISRPGDRRQSTTTVAAPIVEQISLFFVESVWWFTLSTTLKTTTTEIRIGTTDHLNQPQKITTTSTTTTTTSIGETIDHPYRHGRPHHNNWHTSSLNYLVFKVKNTYYYLNAHWWEWWQWYSHPTRIQSLWWCCHMHWPRVVEYSNSYISWGKRGRKEERDSVLSRSPFVRSIALISC
jgi:hypothetical protein